MHLSRRLTGTLLVPRLSLRMLIRDSSHVSHATDSVPSTAHNKHPTRPTRGTPCFSWNVSTHATVEHRWSKLQRCLFRPTKPNATPLSDIRRSHQSQLRYMLLSSKPTFENLSATSEKETLTASIYRCSLLFHYSFDKVWIRNISPQITI